MQITTGSKPTLMGIEPRNPPSVAGKGSILTTNDIQRYELNSTSCKRACSCACHTVYRVKSPSILQSLVGSLLVKSNGLYGLNQPCNEYSCRRSSSASIRISYRFPEWLLNRMVSSLIITNRVCGPQVSLVIPRVVSHTSEIFFHAFSGNIDGVMKLLQAGLASPCDTNENWGYTPLHYAVDRGHMDLCRLLLKAGARPDITDLEENSVTDIAWNKICSKRISSKDAAEFEEMFKKDEWFEERQFTILHKIVLDLLPCRRSLEQELSVSTSNVEISDSEGRTPLSWAAECGNASALKTLLRAGAAVSSKSIIGMTPLHYAAKAPNPSCLSLLLESGAPVTAKNKWDQSALNMATYFQNDASYIDPLLDHGADINERDCRGTTALGNSLYMNHHRAARCLIRRGANITSQQVSGFTGLNDSIETNSHECTALLFESGVNLSLRDLNNETALHILARLGDLQTMEIFQAADLEGLDPDAKTEAGLTAWDLMRRRVDVSEEMQSAFRNLMAKIDGKSNCVTYFDAVEKITLPVVGAKVPDVVEVRVEEIRA